jgi:hypothetical protein
MSVTVDLTSEEVAQIKQITRMQDDAAAVAEAAREYLRLIRLRERNAVSGKVRYEDRQDTMMRNGVPVFSPSNSEATPDLHLVNELRDETP